MFDALCALALDPHRCNWSKHAVLPLLMLVAASRGGAKKSTRCSMPRPDLHILPLSSQSICSLCDCAARRLTRPNAPPNDQALVAGETVALIEVVHPPRAA